MADAFSKLDWAIQHHDRMLAVYADYLKPGGGDKRPVGISFDNSRPPLVVARFTIDEPMPSEMTFLAADVVHNARTALDHVLARLKDIFGGRPGSGGFPVCDTPEKWDQVTNRSKPLKGLPDHVKSFVLDEQPISFQPTPADDPLLVLHRLDNEDKHELLRPAFVYTAEMTGLELIYIKDRRRVKHSTNNWTAGQPLEHGTQLATFRILGQPRGVLAADQNARLSFATGDVGSYHTSYTGMIERVRGIVERAAALIDAREDDGERSG
jgi:hypothetical protein